MIICQCLWGRWPLREGSWTLHRVRTGIFWSSMLLGRGNSCEGVRVLPCERFWSLWNRWRKKGYLWFLLGFSRDCSDCHADLWGGIGGGPKQVPTWWRSSPYPCWVWMVSWWIAQHATPFWHGWAATCQWIVYVWSASSSPNSSPPHQWPWRCDVPPHAPPIFPSLPLSTDFSHFQASRYSTTWTSFP